jgi:hypothetical protein
MTHVTVTAPAMQPYPMIVMALQRALGGSVGVLAARLADGQALVDEDLPDNPPPEQVLRLRQLLRLLATAALPPTVTLNGRPAPEHELQQVLDATELLQANTRAKP